MDCSQYGHCVRRIEDRRQGIASRVTAGLPTAGPSRAPTPMVARFPAPATAACMHHTRSACLLRGGGTAHHEQRPAERHLPSRGWRPTPPPMRRERAADCVVLERGRRELRCGDGIWRKTRRWWCSRARWSRLECSRRPVSDSRKATVRASTGHHLFKCRRLIYFCLDT